jgi:hypothetical protein
LLVAILALLVGSGLGVGAASWVTPSGSAAGNRIGLGFLPASGWTVLQSGSDATSARPAYAIAANVPLRAGDVPYSSGLPYATLLELPRQGIVVVATFTLPRHESWIRQLPARTLPLRMRDATPYIEFGAEIRPERPLGEYQLRANVNGRDVDLVFFFGRPEPSRAQIAAAQRQLDRLVVQPTRAAPSVEQRAFPFQRAPSSAVVASASRVFDRTLACTPGAAHGARLIRLNATTGFREGARFKWDGQVVVATEGDFRPRSKNYRPTMVAMTAGFPPPPPLEVNGIGYSSKLCRVTRAPVRFTTSGLSGGAASQFGDDFTCVVPETVLIRFRGVFRAPVPVTGRDRFITAYGRLDKGQVAVRTPAGKRLAYGEVLDSGKARLFTARGCV